ncbi:adenylosuccinate synthase [bacterium]|nr:adenylosuccinate synthase [bacterium]
MPVTTIIGAQWGDEGKGKLAHLLAADQDFVLRYQGGSNAGHTVISDGQTYKFNLMPSGMLIDGIRCILCDGVVANPVTLAWEIENLRRLGHYRGELFVSRHAHLVLPFHKTQDLYFEEAKGNSAIGTTKQGIGPAYADKYFRVGLRAGDMLLPDFEERVKGLASRKNVLFGGYYDRDLMDPDAVWAEVQPTLELLAPLVKDTIGMVRQAISQDARILLEGAQGTLLDIDYGTYPFVTSSHPISGGALLGTGISWRELHRVVGVAKAYNTRVGAGPFPTEDTGPDGQTMAKTGAEFGTVSGRPRRCGWLDLPLLRYATQLNGFTELAIMKTDVLDDFERIKVCVAYEIDGKRLDWPDMAPEVLERCQPVYEELPGWKVTTSGMRSEGELPSELSDYLELIAREAGAPVRIVSVGADRNATIML